MPDTNFLVFNCFTVEIQLGSFTDVPRDNCSSLLELLESMKKKLVNINNNVGYDLKMNKYNPILLKRIFLHSFLSFSFAYFTKNHCYYVTT